MKVIGKKLIATAGSPTRTFLGLHELTVEQNGKTHPHYMVTRGAEIADPVNRKPDAVIVVAIWEQPMQQRRLVLCDEYRPPIERREVSFPAGMIDASDYDGGRTVIEAAYAAASREMKEETGLDFVPSGASPTIFSSAGMTNESSMIVFGKASGTPSTDGNEHGEDIEVLLPTLKELITMLDDPKLAFSKVAWPFLWAFSKMGLQF